MGGKCTNYCAVLNSYELHKEVHQCYRLIYSCIKYVFCNWIAVRLSLRCHCGWTEDETNRKHRNAASQMAAIFFTSGGCNISWTQRLDFIVDTGDTLMPGLNVIRVIIISIYNMKHV